jgi:tetratricopeptide (TPR) repeat protein
MVDDQEYIASESGENIMLREAIEAIRAGDRKRARDLLTRLLKADQKNAQYWVWLSAVVDTQKERIYCLQTALQADPENEAAKRGLILFGALPPDPNVPPFPVNRPRLWEEKLKIESEPKVKFFSWANPVMRIVIILGCVVIALGLFIGGYSLFYANQKAVPAATPTRRPTFTPTLTPTNTVPPDLRTATPTFLGPTPLWMFLDATYTPTPLYVGTVNPGTANGAVRAGLHFFTDGDYENAMVLFQQALDLEPEAPDIIYYIGEVYRAQGDNRKAKDEYQQAINVDGNFAPAFYGRAVANLAINPKAEVMNDLNEAIRLDPNYTDAYIERGRLLLEDKPSSAKSDFMAAVQNSPNSALANLYLADAELALGENEAALRAAQKANQLDITLVPVYLALARAYIATGQSEEAVSVLQTYTVFAPTDSSAFVALGTAYSSAGQYQQAVSILNKAIDANSRNPEAYLQRGIAYMNLQNLKLAGDDFKSAITYRPSDFTAQLDLAKVYGMQEKPGDAYIQIEQKAYPLAKTNEEKAQVYYWEGIYLEEIGDALSKQGAENAWYQLIALPADAMPTEWRVQAFEHLKITPTFTKTLTPTITPTFTITVPATKTNPATSTPTFTITKNTTKTPSATPTK